MICTSQPTRLALIAALAVWSLLFTSCELYDGELPPTDELNFPNGMAVHPSGRYLYVLSTNFQAEYRTDLGGTVSVVDLETLQLLPERTLCIGSYGGELHLLERTDGQPAATLVATTRSNDGVAVLNVSEDGGRLACQYQGEAIGNTCVSDITDLPGVTRDRRRLPCEINNLTNDPVAAASIRPDANTPEYLESFAVIGLRDGDIRAVNLIEGEIRGYDVSGSQSRDLHLSDTFDLSAGPIASARHPLTDELYVAGRSDNRLFAIDWIRFPVTAPSEQPRSGFVRGIATTSTTAFPLAVDSYGRSAEVRGLAFSTDGTRLYAAAQSPSSVITVDTSLDNEGRPRNLVLDRVNVDGRPAQILFVEHGARRLLYVALFEERAIAVLDADSRRELTRIEVGAEPYSMVADPTRPRIYVSLFEDSSVAVIDADPSSASWNRVIGAIR